MTDDPVLVWFRRDLRLQDNAALSAAQASGRPVIPVYIGEESGDASKWKMGAASRWWLHHSLKALDESLRETDSRLIVLRGDPCEVLPDLVKLTGAKVVHWNRCYEPESDAKDRLVAAELSAMGVAVNIANSTLLFDPDEVRNKQGTPFQVFTPFWRHCLTLPVAPAVKFNAHTLVAPQSWPRSLRIEELDLQPKHPWTQGLAEAWEPGEKSALKQWRNFVRKDIDDYAKRRDQPAELGTSRVSAHLHFGELGPRQIWDGVKARGAETGVFPINEGAKVFLSEVGWREFAAHLLVHFPHTPEKPLREPYARFPWADDPGREKLRAWQRGQTGYPIVDAGMRQLWSTGWMHNRVRMIVASFLVKHLRLSWTEGARWFWDTLVDADLANNTLGWQWVAGCGADASPYFRIFAPVTQGQKFDQEGDYVRRWVPELAAMPNKTIHCPWEASEAERKAAGVTLGGNYPGPMVDHKEAREAALAALQKMKALS